LLKTVGSQFGPRSAVCARSCCALLAGQHRQRLFQLLVRPDDAGLAVVAFVVKFAARQLRLADRLQHLRGAETEKWGKVVKFAGIKAD
jgi:hypothetical protein